MDNCNNLTANDIVPGVGGAIDKGASAAKDIVVSIRNRAKAKKAQKISDAGGYNTLTPFQKSLIPVPAYALNTKTPTAEEARSSEPSAMTTGAMTPYLPYIIGAVILVAVFYFIKK